VFTANSAIPNGILILVIMRGAYASFPQ